MENLIVMPENEKQLLLVKTLLQEMKVKFKIEKSYKNFQDYLSLKIQEAREEKKNGELITVDPRQLWENR